MFKSFKGLKKKTGVGHQKGDREGGRKEVRKIMSRSAEARVEYNKRPYY